MTDSQIEAFPETLPIRVEIDDPKHILELGQWFGLALAAETLKAIPDHKRQPGFGYALALLDAEEAKQRAALMHRNLIAAAKAGVDIPQMQQIGLDGRTLVCTPFTSGETA